MKFGDKSIFLLLFGYAFLIKQICSFIFKFEDYIHLNDTIFLNVILQSFLITETYQIFKLVKVRILTPSILIFSIFSSIGIQKKLAPEN